MTGVHRRGHAGQPPRQRTETIAPRGTELDTDGHHLPTFDHTSPMIAAQLPEPVEPPRTGFGSARHRQQKLGPIARQVVRMGRRRRLLRIAETVVFVLIECGLVVAAGWSFLLAGFYRDDDRLTRVSEASPFFVAIASLLLALVLALWMLWRYSSRP